MLWHNVTVDIFKHFLDKKQGNNVSTVDKCKKQKNSSKPFLCVGKLAWFFDTITLLPIKEVLECVEIVDLLHYLKESRFENFGIINT